MVILLLRYGSIEDDSSGKKASTTTRTALYTR